MDKLLLLLLLQMPQQQQQLHSFVHSSRLRYSTQLMKHYYNTFVTVYVVRTPHEHQYTHLSVLTYLLLLLLLLLMLLLYMYPAYFSSVIQDYTKSP